MRMYGFRIYYSEIIQFCMRVGGPVLIAGISRASIHLSAIEPSGMGLGWRLCLVQYDRRENHRDF